MITRILFFWVAISVYGAFAHADLTVKLRDRVNLEDSIAAKTVPTDKNEKGMTTRISLGCTEDEAAVPSPVRRSCVAEKQNVTAEKRPVTAPKAHARAR